MPLLELEEIGLRVRGSKAIASDVWSCVLLRFDSRFRSTPFSLSSSAKGEGEVARAEGEAEVALERLALARAGEEKDAALHGGWEFSISSSAKEGEEAMIVPSSFASSALLRPVLSSLPLLLSWAALPVPLFPQAQADVALHGWCDSVGIPVSPSKVSKLSDMRGEGAGVRFAVVRRRFERPHCTAQAFSSFAKSRSVERRPERNPLVMPAGSRMWPKPA